MTKGRPKGVKNKAKVIIVIDKDKEVIINEIRGLDHMFDKLEIDLYKFSLEELKKHLLKLKGKR